MREGIKNSKANNSEGRRKEEEIPVPVPVPVGVLHTPKLSIGCPVLDRFLGGGIPCNTITELVAESGSGKTQLCLQLLLHSPSSLFLHSELPFPRRRLQQFSVLRPSLMDDVILQPLESAYHLLELFPRIDALLSDRPIKLIVMDSVAALFRSEFGNHQKHLKERASLFFKIASGLKAQAIKHGVAVVITNQVVDVLESEDENENAFGNSDCFYSSGRIVRAALGLSWAHCVNIRLFLWREEEERLVVDVGDHQLHPTTTSSSSRRRIKRFIRVVFAPHLPESCCQFVIKREGVFGIVDDAST